MGSTTAQAWICDVCGYVWLKIGDKIPTHCPNRKCRSRKWNQLSKPIEIAERLKVSERINLPNRFAAAVISGEHHQTCTCYRCKPPKPREPKSSS